LVDTLSPMVWQTEVEASDFYQSFRTELADFQVQLVQKPADVLFSLHTLEVNDTLLGKVRTLRATAVWSLTNQWGDTVIYRRISSEQVSDTLVETDSDLAQLTAELHQALSQNLIAQLSQVTLDQLDSKPTELP
ncbi:MAG: outer membrane lipopolysaccharide assembly protein LptE/RlpB, partial [Reinekea sp.]